MGDRVHKPGDLPAGLAGRRIALATNERWGEKLPVGASLDDQSLERDRLMPTRRGVPGGRIVASGRLQASNGQLIGKKRF